VTAELVQYTLRPMTTPIYNDGVDYQINSRSAFDEVESKVR